MSGARDPGVRRRGEFRRLGQVLGPSLERVATSDQARAYGAWARAAGEQVEGGARPRNFTRGTLTVECTSSVWANELTYLSGEIMRRMDALSPDHPVKRLRFLVSVAPPAQESDTPSEKCESRREAPVPGDLSEARAEVEGVRDERLRAAVAAALQASGEGSSGPPADCTPTG
jgi:hypothetical protein